ncbi:MAG: ABC transporter ATP-binding protein/permease [Candidatus Methanoplasma sp.]|jgi:ATP-binding cassette subfamily B protein|nr:ABC transporter ATP-binding protein/permease [Candidatus Methanoplasma sp.]
MWKSLSIVTGGENKRMLVPTIWAVLQAAWKGTPLFFVYLIVLELFEFENGSPLNTEALWLYFAAVAVMLLMQYGINSIAYLKQFITSYELVAVSREKMGEHLRHLPMGYFRKNDPGDTAALMLQDMDKVEQTFSHLFGDIMGAFALPAVMTLYLAYTDTELTLVLLGAVLLSIPALYAVNRVLNRFSERKIKSSNKASSLVLEYLYGMKTLKAYNRTGEGFKRLDQANIKSRRDSIVLEAVPGPLIGVYQIVIELGFILAIIIGSGRVIDGSLTVSAFLMFLILGYAFCEPLKVISMYLAEMRFMNVAADRIAGVLGQKPLPEPDESKVPEKYDIEFKDAAFSYEDKRAIDGVSVKLPEKSITALVGPSGSGKTTMTNLIARFWDVDSGSVTIGGIDVRDMHTDDLLRLVSVVFQDVYLFNDTIFNNIRIGNTDASREQIIAAAKAAECHEFIEALPEGYETMVGEGGSTLSGGEKQRISIARAMLKDAPIILLDEATSSLDPENERSIQAAVAKLVVSKTVVVIAHRLNTISSADRIVVLDQGKVSEVGRHSDLLENGGLYAKLWNEQTSARGWRISARSSGSVSE